MLWSERIKGGLEDDSRCCFRPAVGRGAGVDAEGRCVDREEPLGSGAALGRTRIG